MKALVTISRIAPRRIAAAMLLLAVLSPAAFAQTPLKVVASFSVLADLVRNVGGDRIDIVTLVGPGGEAHAYTPSPADARAVAAAKLVFINGLGLEGWLPRLGGATGRGARIVEVSSGVEPRKAPGGRGGEVVDPHAWMAVANASRYVANIRDALSAADPAGASDYAKAAAAYLARLGALDREVRAALEAIPPDQRKLVTVHDAFGYFAAAYGLQPIALQGVASDAEPTAQAMAALVGEIRNNRIPAIFREPASDPRLVDRIARETGIKIGGVLYSDSLTETKGEAPTYIDLIRHNIRVLTTALSG
jgi:zinc/manganese transport system substrate-binding protein